MVPKVPNVVLNNGKLMPAIGLGTWKSKPGEVTQAVKDAIDAGYRHLDCALYYLNEEEVGAGIKAKIDEGVVKREDLFVTSKLWCNLMRPDLVEPTIKKSLGFLGLDYLDLYLIHWPTAFKQGEEYTPKGPDGKTLYSDIDYVDTWKAFEEIHRKGLAKSIGVSNFNKRQLERVLEVASVKPVTNQVECHPYLNQKKLTAFCKSKDIVITAYSPLGSPDRPWAKPGDPILVQEPKILALAEKYKKSPAQVILRYLHQLGVVPIPKSVTKSRIIENLNIFDFVLEPSDVAVMDSFDCNGRVCQHSEGAGHPNHPFENDEY
ncbi:aldo-keto reductase family 1 member B1-like [Anthonomus grandis grandis]|uniref:aldo-keto reductase family 1 member B1-like n=1 Tax=Anthonomus grandis grandis TaxID=2921223 RepID=UPI0021650045|nr:aldo-keto reductase family 1 member B1-like [Anthonomus grandis grandis]